MYIELSKGNFKAITAFSIISNSPSSKSISRLFKYKATSTRTHNPHSASSSSTEIVQHHESPYNSEIPQHGARHLSFLDETSSTHLVSIGVLMNFFVVFPLFNNHVFTHLSADDVSFSHNQRMWLDLRI